MSSDGQPLGVPTTDATPRGTHSPGLEDVDLYEPSATSIDTSKDSLSHMTSLNTQANAQRPATERQETVKSILNSENANDVPFVRTPSPMSIPSLAPGPLQLSHNGATNMDAGSRRNSVAENDLSIRGSSSRQNSDLRQDSNARKDSNSPNNDLNARQNSYSRRNSDIGGDQSSRRGSDIRQNSDTRKDSDPPESLHTSSRLPRHLRDEQKSVHGGSPLNPANSHEEFKRLSRHRHGSSRRLPTPPITNPAFSANPYAGMGVYATPQMYASPLSIPQYMPPPIVDYSHIYSPNTQPNSHLPPDAPAPWPSAASPIWPGSHISNIPPGVSPAMSIQPSPATRQSVSSNIVAAAAMTPEMKNMKSTIGSMAPPDTGSNIDNNLYYLRSKEERAMPDLRSPYPIPGPMPLPTGFQPLDPVQQYPSPYYQHESYSGRAPSAAFSPFVPPIPNVTQDIPNGFQPNSPWARNSASATNSLYGHSAYGSRGRSHSRVDEPSQQYDYSGYPQRQKTAADVVSAASNTPIPEKKKTESFTENGPYRSSATRRNTVSPIPERKATGSFAEHNPYRLSSRRDTVSPIPERKTTGSFAEHNPYRIPSRRATMDAPTPPPIPPSQQSWNQVRPRRSRGRSSSSTEEDYYTSAPWTRRRRSPNRDGWDSEKYKPSRSYRPSPSPDYYRPSRSRRRRRSYSPFKYGTMIPPVYPTTPYGTPPSSFDAMPPDPKYRRHNYRRPRFWSRFSNFFKSPFDSGRPASFQNPYPRDRATEEPVTFFFIITVIIGQVYFHLLLRLPSLYFSRVSRIFDEANLNLYEITEMAFETAGGPDLKDKSQMAMNMQVAEPVAPKIRPQYERLKSSWESFIDSLIREWETFNIVSVMLLTAILTILQITTAATDPVTRYAALFSLMCALVSLLFGCMYIIRFGTMRKTYAAVEWAKSALGSSQSVIWNVWVLLSMPAVWLTWSIILFIVAIMSFVWRTNPANDNASTLILSSTGLLVIRIVMSAVLGLGVLNALLITNTFRLYGEVLDKDWRMWIDEWQKAKAIEAPMNLLVPGSIPPGGYTPYMNYGQPLAHMTPLPTPSSLPHPPPVAPIIPSAPYFSPSYADLVNRRSYRRRRRRAGRHLTRSYEEGDATSSSESRSRSPRRRVRRRSSSPAEPPQYVRPSSRDPPARNNVYSQTPRIPEYDLPPDVVSPIPRRPTRSHHDPPYVDPVEIRNSYGSPVIPPLESDNDEDHDPQSRVRFRSPLESARGSSDWGAYDSSFDYPSPNIIGPSSSSASGITQESSNVQIQKPSDALRRRRP